MNFHLSQCHDMNIPGTRDTSALNAYKLALWECQQERDKAIEQRDKAIKLLKLYVERFFSLDAAKELIAECEAKK